MVAGAVGLDPALRITAPEGHGLRERERGVPACGLERGYLTKNRRRKLTKVPVQPPREERAREYKPTKEMKAESERARPARDTKKANFN